MAGGKQNESTSNNRTNVSRSRFEQDVVRYDTPPWYLKPDRHETETIRHTQTHTEKGQLCLIHLNYDLNF